MTTMAGLRSGYTDRLIVRAADVPLKERRRLVLLARETPLKDIQRENMRALSHVGAIVAPPVPALYNTPQSVEELVDYTVGRVLDRLRLEIP